MLQWFKYYAMLCQYCRYKHVHTFLSITLLIFNRFSIWKKFWTAENQCFLTISNIHACRYSQYRHKISNAFNAMLCRCCRHKHVHTFLSITLLIFNGFSIWKKFWTTEYQSFLTIPSIHACRYCRYRHKISNAFNAMDVDHCWYTVVRITLCIIVRSLRITWKFELKSFINSNDSLLRIKALYQFELGALQINSVRINHAF